MHHYSRMGAFLLLACLLPPVLGTAQLARTTSLLQTKDEIASFKARSAEAPGGTQLDRGAFQSGAFRIETASTNLGRSNVDFVTEVGVGSDGGFSLGCSPAAAVETWVTVTVNSPALSPRQVSQGIRCDGSQYGFWLRFRPEAAGVTNNSVTVSSDMGVATFDLIGNAVPLESPVFWAQPLGPAGEWGSHNLLYDRQRNYVYITDQTGNRVIVFSAYSRSLLATIPVGKAPVGMTLSQDGSHLYTANSGDLTISEIGLANLAEERRIRVPNIGPDINTTYRPNSVAMIGNTALLIGTWPTTVASGGPILKLDLQTEVVTPRPDLGSGRWSVLAVSDDYSKIAIMPEPGSSPTSVTLYDVATGLFSITDFGTLGIERSLAINKDGTLLLASRSAASLSGMGPGLQVLDGSLSRKTGITTLASQPQSPVISPTGKFAYIGSDLRDPYWIHEVSLDTMMQTRVFKPRVPNYLNLVGESQGMAVSPDGTWLYALFTAGEPANRTEYLLAMMVQPGRTFIPISFRGYAVGW